MNLAEEMYELATNPPKQILDDEYVEITDRIKIAASNGVMCISIKDTDIHIHKQVIEQLEKDGFKISYDFITYTKEQVYIISWNKNNKSIIKPYLRDFDNEVM